MYRLTEEGLKYLKEGLPEKKLLKLLLEKERTLEEISKLKESTIAIGWARRNGWIEIEKGIVKISERGKRDLRIETPVEKALDDVKKSGTANLVELEILKSRNLIEEMKEEEKKPGLIEKLFARKERIEEVKEVAQLTPDLIKTGEWRKMPFRKYDVLAPAPKIYAGQKQPYIQFIEDIKEKLIGLGFQEMQGPLVETFFWNCDALFMPQDHPARGLHDVLILKNPKIGKLPDKNLMAKVKATHEGGWITESSGWGSVWDEKEAEKLLMRSQTTAVSARTLMEHGDKPGKYFSIGRNYRFDIIDAKHLMEFYQCEGIVIGEDLTFRHLLGFLKELAESIGIKEIRFKPGYFPFTEPSVEGFIRHPKLGWIECLPAGLIRPEVLRPLGIEKCQVLAWGLGIDRLAMFKLGIDDIRMLYSDNIDWLRKTGVVK